MNDKNGIYKYVAILHNKHFDRLVAVPFGNIKDTHFRDTTGLNTYSHLDNNNYKLRQLFIKNTIHHLKPDYYSSIYFELKYLYNYEVDCLYRFEE